MTDLVRLEARILAQDPALRAPETAGRALRGYRLIEQIGVGPAGTVYRATQPGVGPAVHGRPALADRRLDHVAVVQQARFVSGTIVGSRPPH